MDFFDNGGGEILLILIIILAVMGPSRDIKVDQSLGKMMMTLKKTRIDMTSLLAKELADQETKNRQKMTKRN